MKPSDFKGAPPEEIAKRRKDRKAQRQAKTAAGRENRKLDNALATLARKRPKRPIQ
jgi:hypothetical protein